MKNSIINSALSAAIILSILQGWFFLAVIFLAVFTSRCNTLWLIPVAVMIDGYFGMFYSVPVLSLFAIAWHALIETLRPRLMSTSYAS